MMENKIKTWWTNLPTLQQVILIFICNWLLWFGAAIFAQWFGGEDDVTLRRIDLISSFFMAVSWTLFFDFSKVKSLFTKKKSNA